MDTDRSALEIGVWLESLGLSRYRQVFIDEEIDPQLLPDLTEDELKSMGLPLGARKKIIKAAGALQARGKSLLRADRAATLAAGPRPRPVQLAERRNLTVLTCDMVESTALATQIDPEQLRDIMHGYFDACSEVVEHFGGFVAKYTGDGLMAYFGYPEAQEDTAERAVRAGLQMIEVVRTLEPSPGIRLQSRIGIATGLTVVGDLIGEGAAREEAVVGAAPALAARLQALAPANGVTISNATRRLVRGIFALEDLGRRELKGFPHLPRVWRVVGEAKVESRFAAARRDRQVALIGRDAELALLLDRWRPARTGSGQLVLLSGEAGIGKSRLVDALRQHLADEAPDVVVLQSSSYYRNSSFHPLIEWLERAAEVMPEDAPAIKLSKLQARLPLPQEAVVRIAELLSVSTDIAAKPADPSVRKEQLLTALVDVLTGTSSPIPRLLAVEDAHWSDASTVELLGRVVACLASRPILLIVTFRPDFRVPWPSSTSTTQIVLSRLEHRDCAQLVARLTGSETLPPALQFHIVDKAEGVPLFVEELTKSVLESGIATPDFESSGRPLQLAVPSTLHDTLMARLDRLASVKVIAQTAAALGREFPYRMLAACLDIDMQHLEQGLVQLADAGLLFCNGEPPNATYVFKHALVRDVAYNSMLLSRRATLHAEIARVLEGQFSELVAMRPELLAHHYTEAGFLEKAILWWQRAGERALHQSAHVEAANHLQTALTLLEKRPADLERDRVEVALRLRLVGPLYVTTGFASPQTEENYARTAQLTEQVGPTVEAVRVLWGQAAMVLVRSDLHKVGPLAERLIRLANRADIKNASCLGHRLIGYDWLVRGDIRRARERFDLAMEEFDPQGPRFVFDDWPLDVYASSMSQDVLVLQQEGFLDQALRQGEEALNEARRISSQGTEGYVLLHIALANMIAGDVLRTSHVAHTLRELADHSDIQYFRWHEEVMLGWVDAKSGALNQGIARMRHGLELRRKRMSNLWVPVYVLNMAEPLMEHGRHNEAFPIFDECEVLFDELLQRFIKPELHRLRAIALHAINADPVTVENSFNLALEAARRQGARLFELRAATSLARVWEPAGRREAAYALLAPILAGFAEGFSSPDLRQARAVIASLASVH
jgi:class 3 adenylate cyclase/tetratricopeptide (TPR) repeat protein